jgi:hypothetical protein
MDCRYFAVQIPGMGHLATPADGCSSTLRQLAEGWRQESIADLSLEKLLVPP